MDLKGPLPREFAERASRIKRVYDDNSSLPPLDRDTPLTVPMEEWERGDREGTYGTGKRFFLGPGSRKYKERYALIDWTQ